MRPESPAFAIHRSLVLPSSETTTLDLGGRSVRVVPRAGHTDSDISLELADANVVFCGDLFWNGMVPNYVDAVPTTLASSVRALRANASTTYIPGHGAIGHAADYDRYANMLDEIERGARAGFDAGKTAAEAGAQFTLPASLGEWILFNKSMFQTAFLAWYKVLAK